MSSTERLRLHVQSLLARGLASPSIAHQVGIAAASEIWGGREPRDRPGWYVWTRERRGAYALELDEVEAVERRGAALHVGRLSVRHFPSATDAEFASFSPEEQALVLSGWIDASGAPDIHHAHDVPPSYFVIGALDLVVRDVGETALLGLSTVDRLRWSYAEEWTGLSPPLGTVHRRRGERTRDVPAWSLAWPLFSVLGGLIAQAERRPASRLVEARLAGFELVHRGGAFAHEDVRDVAHRELLLEFAHDGDEGEDAMARSLVDDSATIVADVSFTRPGGGGEAGAPHAAPGDAAPVSVPASWFPVGPAPRQVVACGC